ncbi:hypothetical protein RB601_007311 [Gaeumannomyces tritici]
MKPLVSAIQAWSCVVISVFAIVILSVLGLLFNSNNHELVGGREDPKNGPAVASTIFVTVLIYAVGFPPSLPPSLCYPHPLLFLLPPLSHPLPKGSVPAVLPRTGTRHKTERTLLTRILRPSPPCRVSSSFAACRA